MGYDGFWFVVLYLTGAYLGKYETKWVQARWHAVLLYLCSVTAIFASFFYSAYGFSQNRQT